jgi:membrane-bound lytic murein transglycosylase B
MKRTLISLCGLLCAAPALAATYAGREDVQAFVAAMEERHGLDAASLDALFARTQPIPAVLKAIAPPTDPGVRSWAAYRQRFIEPRRIAAGLDFWKKHRATLAKAQALTGVPAEIIVAIVGIETFYGKHLGGFGSFAALATLAFDYPPRAELFRRELEALLLLARDDNRAPDSYRGSYAGAIGLPQFLPSSVRAYAVDFDRNGRIELVGSPADAIGSVANFLKEHGWENDGPVAVPVKVGAGKTVTALPKGRPEARRHAPEAQSAPDEKQTLPVTDARGAHEVSPPVKEGLGEVGQNLGVGGTVDHETLIAEGILPTRRPAEMSQFGVAVPGDAPDAPAALIDLVTPNAATEYWLGYRNFYVITRYNRSSFYAMTVFQFARALKERLR